MSKKTEDFIWLVDEVDRQDDSDELISEEAFAKLHERNYYERRECARISSDDSRDSDTGLSLHSKTDRRKG